MFGIFDPQSPQAGALYDTFVATLALCGVIFALVCGLVFYAVWKYRHRGGDAEPVQVHGQTRLEIAWTVAPALVVVVLFALSVRAMRAADPTPDREPDLVMVAHQWWWEARYPRAGVVTANEIHIPVGEDVLVRVESADVIHDFWVAELGRKIDAVPGHPNTIWIRADQPRTYAGACAEFCGTQHAWMLFDVVAEPRPQYDAWLAAQAAAGASPQSPPELEGAAVFARHTCSNCHAIRGTAAVAAYAPDLTHVASRARLGAGVARNEPEAMLAWLRDPRHLKPGSNMPAFKLSDADARALTSYMLSLR